ncbi:GNAT family N-acetyltransferase [Burkholderia sp. R-69608]|uniref:GNAT family N-acetyltransferase n=1 Tax=Paraburkholderia nemoris TaxID=2793076 RepID=UPI0019140D7D|nr:GNAT family N-acetyltransferase [Paraburkholderia nemoris]MBK5148561.1 GNAT family N-acetyltransferase [Burkholderia sp. R-69608]
MESSNDQKKFDAREIESDDYLDNVVWAALSEAHADLSQGYGDALRYSPEFAPFGAAQDYKENSVAEIAAMLRGAERLTLFTLAKPEIPPGYDIVREGTVVQMIGGREFLLSKDERIVGLGKDDIADMLQLVELTDPGPFKQRTAEMGRFVGIREGGKLVAMAGERMVAGRYVEVSAVCTHPDWRGRGLAGMLMEHLSATMQQRGKIPFLHVFSNNTSAMRLYYELGFRKARSLYVTVLVVSPVHNA